MNRRFCSRSETSSRLSRCTTLTQLRTEVENIIRPLEIEDAVLVLKRCIELKRVNDPKSRGLIPKQVLEKVSDSIITGVDTLSPGAVADTVLAIGDNSRCMDEYMMFKLARTISDRVEEFTLTQLLDISRVFSKRDIRDEAMFPRIIESVLARKSNLSFPNLVDFNRSLSRIAVKNTRLCNLIAAEYLIQRTVSVRDIISCLIAFADLDFDHVVVDKMWDFIQSKDNVCKYTSNDDQYGLLFAALRFPTSASYRIVDEIISNAWSKNRIRKRIDLFRRCVALGMLDDKFVNILLTPSNTPKISDDTAASSSLHLEVCDTLRRMRGVRYTNEFDLGPFIVDILVRKK